MSRNTPAAPQASHPCDGLWTLSRRNAGGQGRGGRWGGVSRRIYSEPFLVIQVRAGSGRVRDAIGWNRAVNNATVSPDRDRH